MSSAVLLRAEADMLVSEIERESMKDGGRTDGVMTDDDGEVRDGNGC
jgi:hypothetical protein